MKISIRIAIALLTLGLVTAACGDDDAANTTFNATGAVTTGAPVTTSAASVTTVASGSDADRSASESVGNDGAATTDAATVIDTLDPADFGRSIIYTANLVVEVEDVLVAGEQVKLAIQGLGGLLFGQETTTGGEARSVLTIKVRPQDFEEALHRLSGIGTLISQTVYADDVTDRVVDIESRIITAAASVERLRTFLEAATDLEGVATLEQELLRRETDLELLRGQLRTLEDAVSLATIVIVLSEAENPRPTAVIEMVETAYFGHDGGLGCPGADDVVVDEGDPVTLCYELTNTGRTRLTEIAMRNRQLGARPADFIVVTGDATVPLEPDERMILALEIEADYPVRTEPTVVGTAVGVNDQALRIELQVVEGEELLYMVEEDTSLPGFGDALSGAWETLQGLFGLIVVLAGVAIPFLWVPLALAAIWYWRRRKQTPSSPPKSPPAEPQPAEAEDAGAGIPGD